MEEQPIPRAIGESPYESIVGELERVELEARERRLIAESEADHLRASAADAVVGIEAGVPGRIAAALAELRARHVDAAAAEVAALEGRLVAEEGPPAGPGPVAEEAVDLLVAAVLAEPTR